MENFTVFCWVCCNDVDLEDFSFEHGECKGCLVEVDAGAGVEPAKPGV